nr:hypothetical protein CFP56_69759 [Quercus suber]
MHKEHAIEMIKSIIKDTDFDPCAEQLTEDLKALGLFDLARDQYKDALHTLNKEVTELTEKLREETYQWEDECEAKVTLEELTALLGQVETARPGHRCV